MIKLASAALGLALLTTPAALAQTTSGTSSSGTAGSSSMGTSTSGTSSSIGASGSVGGAVGTAGGTVSGHSSVGGTTRDLADPLNPLDPQTNY